MLLYAKNIDQFTNMIERRLGIDTKLFNVYSIRQLTQFVNNGIPFSKIKSEFKTIWLK